jgi:hypothetical protein
MNIGITQVNVSSDYADKILTNSLKSNNMPWFSYENKQNRGINILRRLNYQGLQALNLTSKLKWKAKKLLPMFIVSFRRNTNISKIFNIETICRAAVTLESIIGYKLIPQCKIC